MFLTLLAPNQKVQLNSAQFICDFNFLEELNAKMLSCFITGEFVKRDLNTAFAKGFVEVEIATQCFRCGSDVKFKQKLMFDEIFTAYENDDCYVLNGSQIELDQMIIDLIMLNFPKEVLCKKDCKGLCGRCGKNLNLEECECDKELELLDPANPFSKLKQLKVKLGGNKNGSSKNQSFKK